MANTFLKQRLAQLYDQSLYLNLDRTVCCYIVVQSSGVLSQGVS